MTQTTTPALILLPHWEPCTYTAMWDGVIFKIVYLGRNVWAVNLCRECRGRTPRLAAEAYIEYRWRCRP